MKTELNRISFYQTLADYELQQETFSKLKKTINSGLLTKDRFDSIKRFILPSGLDVEGFITLNIDHGFLKWSKTENGAVLKRVEKGGEKNE